MAEQNDYNANEEAFVYKTMWTNKLFEDSRPMLRYSTMGLVNIRIPWSSVILGIIFGAISLLFVLGIVSLFNASGFFLPIGFAGSMGVAFIGAKLGRWSPMQKTTGEDLFTYIKFTLRNKVATGGFRAGKLSKTMLKSRAIGGEEGKMVECTEFLGTQPLRNAPPMSPYHRDYKSPYHLEPSGVFSVVPSKGNNDGLGDRGLS